MPALPVLFASVLLAVPPILGGTVTFDPPSAVLDPGLGQTTATFEVSVTSTSLSTINSMDVIIGSDSLTIKDFALPVIFPFAGPLPSVRLPASPPVYPSDVQIGWFSFVGLVPANLLSGTLTVTAEESLSPGDYYVEVNAARDGGRSILGGPGLVTEPLFGLARVTVVPEPATGIVLLLMVAVVLQRGRRTRP